MKKVLIGTPVRDTVTPEYMQGLLGLLMHSPAPFPNVTWEIAIIQGTGVNFARNTLVIEARKLKCDEIFFIDADMGFSLGMMKLLMDLDGDKYPIVAGLYTKKKFMPKWLFNQDEKTGLNEDKNNVLKVADAATGFMRIQMSVFDKIQKKFPEIEYDFVDNEEDMTSVKSEVGHDFFSMGVVNRVLRGEDYYFCHRANEAGCSVHVHMGCVVPHVGKAAFPLDPEAVCKLSDFIRGFRATHQQAKQ